MYFVIKDTFCDKDNYEKPLFRHKCLNFFFKAVSTLDMAISNEKDAVIAFGKKVRLKRKEKKMPMQMLANIAEIEISQIYRIETGKINPKLTTILKIAEALEIDVKELF